MNWAVLLPLALEGLKAAATLYDKIFNAAKATGEMTSEQEAGWIIERNKIFSQPWHQKDPDPTSDEG